MVIEKQTTMFDDDDMLRLLRAYVDAATAGFLIFSPEGELVDVNERVCEMYGYGRDEMLAMAPKEFIAPQSHHIFDAFMETLSRGEPFTSDEAYDVRRDGTPFESEVIGRRITIEGKRYHFASLIDITRRRQAERDLREFEQHRGLVSEVASRLLKTHPDEMNAEIELCLERVGSLHDLDFCGLWWLVPSNRWEERNRWIRDSLRSEAADWPRTETIEGVRWASDLVLAGEPVRLEDVAESPPEAQVWTKHLEGLGIRSVLVLPLLVDEILVGGFLIGTWQRKHLWPDSVVSGLQTLGDVIASSYSRALTMQHLTDRKAELARSQHLAHVGSFVYYPKSNVYTPSPELDTIFGHHDSEETPETWAVHVHPDDREAFLEVVQRLIDRESESYHVYRYVRADGSNVVCETWWEVERDEEGSAERVFGTIRDITQLRETQEELEAALTQVERLKQQIENENVYLSREVSEAQGFDQIIGKSAALKRCLRLVERVAPTNATVLITGETGTGKELLARAIHDKSGRKGPLVSINCAALPANLIESELFGYEKGAFTGAHARKAGRLELADRGTLFLDEIGEIPFDLQAKMLRVLQECEFQRLGSTKTQKFEGRVITATNRDLQKVVARGEFRSDLYFRLNVFPIEAPPLRERTEDIPLLAQHFTEKHGKELGREIESLSSRMLDHLVARDWPGNVRELESFLQRQMILGEGPVLELHEPSTPQQPVARAAATGELRRLEDVDRDYIRQVLEETGWSVEGPSGAASVLGLAPSTLRSRMRRLGIQRDR